jgi:primosomal protein N'
MTKNKESTQTIDVIRDLNVIDLVLIDHRFLKECIEVLIGNGAPKRKRMSVAKSFLYALATHSLVEKKAVYAPLESNEKINFIILEAENEHQKIDQKVKSLQLKLLKARSFKDEVIAEFKVLAEMVMHHLTEEESEFLPKMLREIDHHALKELGKSYMKLRNFTAKELQNYPQLQDELIQWKDSTQKISSDFLIKMDKFVENIQH